MKLNWKPLDAELAQWAETGMTLPLWWRDDDAVAATAALDRLSDLAASLDMPVHLAVIPAMADKTLAEKVSSDHHLIPMVHGWGHFNHAPKGEKKNEFGDHRPLGEMVEDARRGMTRLGDLFGDALRPVFVPPWNRISARFIAELPGLGYQALSTFTPRLAVQAAPGMEQINSHLDPVAWHARRAMANPNRLIKQISAQLANRRQGTADNGEPYGILTHHLVLNDDIWEFTGQLMRHLSDGPIHHWIAPPTTT